MENKSFIYMELWNSSFMFEKMYTECIKHNKTSESNPCDIYKKKYESSRDIYTNCLIKHNTEKNDPTPDPTQCDQFKKNYEKYAGLCFNTFRENTNRPQESSR